MNKEKEPFTTLPRYSLYRITYSTHALRNQITVYYTLELTVPSTVQGVIARVRKSRTVLLTVNRTVQHGLLTHKSMILSSTYVRYIRVAVLL